MNLQVDVYQKQYVLDIPFGMVLQELLKLYCFEKDQY